MHADVITSIREIRRQFRDVYGFTPSGGTTDNPLFSKGQLPDGDYPMTINNKLEQVRIKNDSVSFFYSSNSGDWQGGSRSNISRGYSTSGWQGGDD